MVAELGSVDRRGVSKLHRDYAGSNGLDETWQLQRDEDGKRGGGFLRLPWILALDVEVLEELRVRT